MLIFFYFFRNASHEYNIDIAYCLLDLQRLLNLMCTHYTFYYTYSSTSSVHKCTYVPT